MKYIIPLSILILLAFQATGQEVNKLDADGKKQGKWIKTFDGSEDIRYIGQFEKDVPVGEFKYYYSSGELQAVTIFIDGVNRSKTTMYHVNGAKMAAGNYIKQLRDSVWVLYDERGFISATETYMAGKLHGKRSVFYIDSTLTEECFYENGVKHGPWRQFFNDGKPKMIGQCINDNYDGKVIFYHENGAKSLEGKYEAAVKNGNWYQYKPTGELEQVLYYKWGKLLDEEQKENFKKFKEQQGAGKEGFSTDEIKEVKEKNE